MNAGSATEAVTQGTTLVSVKMFEMRSRRPAGPMSPDRAMAFAASQLTLQFLTLCSAFKYALDCLPLPLVSNSDLTRNTPWHHSSPRSRSASFVERVYHQSGRWPAGSGMSPSSATSFSKSTPERSKTALYAASKCSWITSRSRCITSRPSSEFRRKLCCK